MDNSIVSIIIPVYKVEKYLGECVESVIHQDYPFLEVILVDDGSPDLCPQMCDEYARQYQHVKAIHKKNEGLGAARNSGMEISHGKYVMFLDSDDKFDGTGAVSILVKKAEETGADIVMGGFRRLVGNELSAVNRLHVPSEDYTQTVDFRFNGFMSGHLSYDWGKLYRRSFLENHHIQCCTYPFTQDKIHNMQCCVCKPVYAFVDEGIVQYRVNEFSTTFKYKNDYGRVWMNMASDFENFMRERQIEGDYGDLVDFHVFIGSFFIVKQELANSQHGFRWAVRALREYGRNPLVKRAMGELARGKYVVSLYSVWMKMIIIMAAILFKLHGYILYTAGIALLRRLEIDSQITKSRYQSLGKG